MIFKISNDNKGMYRYILVIIIILLSSLSSIFYDKIRLDNSAIRINGIIYKTKALRKNSYEIFVHFYYNDKRFESTDSYNISISNFYKVDVNDTVVVEFLEDDPETNRIDINSFRNR